MKKQKKFGTYSSKYQNLTVLSNFNVHMNESCALYNFKKTLLRSQLLSKVTIFLRTLTAS